MTFAYQISEVEVRLRSTKESYLRRWGWVSTCNTPGAYWLWQRDFRPEDRKAMRRWRNRKPGPMGKPPAPKPYGLITADTELALRMTISFLDEQKELGGEE